MNKELRQKWIDALRSGKYKKGIGKLYNPKTDCYCALGVLCKVADIELTEDGELPKIRPRFNSYDPIYNIIGGKELAQKVFQRNDFNPEKPFTDVADYIEQNIPNTE